MPSRTEAAKRKLGHDATGRLTPLRLFSTLPILDVSVIAIARERVPAREGVANRRRRIRLARKLRQRGLEPLAQRSEQRLRPRLAYLAAFFRWPAANLFLNRVQRADSV